MSRGAGGGVLALGVAALAASWAFGALPLVPLGIGLTLAGFGSLAWRSVAGRDVTVERVVPPGPRVERTDLRIVYSLGRRLRVPGGSVVVRERIGGLGTQELRLAGGSATALFRRVPRGVYPFEDGELVLADPLGLERVASPLPVSAPLVVHPDVPELVSAFSDAGPGHGGGRRVLLRPLGGFDFHSVREHAEGESLRRVHWPTTARRGRLMVKELEDTTRDDVAVVLDCDPAGVTGTPEDSSFDAAVRAAAGLARLQAKRGRRVVLVLGAATVRVSSLDGEWREALDLLAAIEPDPHATLVTALADPRSAVARAQELVAVTALPDPRAADRLLAAVLGGRRVSLVLVDAASFAGRPAAAGRPELLRLAAAGVSVAVVRRGDDLRGALEAREAVRAHA